MAELRNVTALRRRVLGFLAEKGPLTSEQIARLVSGGFERADREKPRREAGMWGAGYMAAMVKAGLVRSTHSPHSNHCRYALTEQGRTEHDAGQSLPLFAAADVTLPQTPRRRVR